MQKREDVGRLGLEVGNGLSRIKLGGKRGLCYWKGCDFWLKIRVWGQIQLGGKVQCNVRRVCCLEIVKRVLEEDQKLIMVQLGEVSLGLGSDVSEIQVRFVMLRRRYV